MIKSFVHWFIPEKFFAEEEALRQAKVCHFICYSPIELCLFKGY